MDKLLTLSDLRDRYLRKTRLLRVIDGDTLSLYIEQGFTQGFEENVRLLRVNTPEERGPESIAGKWVTRKVQEWCDDVEFLWMHSVDYDRDRYGRVVADIYKPDGENLNTWLLTNGYGWMTDDSGAIIGPRDIQRLNLPKGIINQVLIEQR